MMKYLRFLLCKTVLTLIIGSLLFYIGCLESRNQIDSNDSTKKTYTLKLPNEYETSTDYLMTGELSGKYVKILNGCPIPLRVRTYKEYKKQYISKVIKKYPKYKTIEEFAGENTSGQHVMGWPVKGWPNYFLFVRAVPSPHALMGTYFHEIGHYDCTTNKCPYCKAHGHKHVSELHAIINELESAMEYDFPEVMASSFVKYYGWLLDYDNYKKYQEYADAVLKIQKTKLWVDVKKYSKKHGISPPIYEKPKKTIIIKIIFKSAA